MKQLLNLIQFVRRIMLEKIKALGVSARGILLYLIIPLVSVGGYIYYLLTQLSKLKSEIEVNKAEKQLANTLDKVEETKHESEITENEYNNTFNQYIKDYGPIGESQPPSESRPKDST